MTTGEAISAPTEGQAEALRGERRQITALFMDIVGFSAVASAADPEDLQQWLTEFYAQARAIVEAHGGEVTEYLGDGIVALFGLANGGELAASRAVNAAMTALEKIDAGHRDGITTELRIGIATGEAAVRADGGDDHLPRATGMVTTLAQRIQERAPPGKVLISESTKALLRRGFATRKFTQETLKGFACAQTLFQPLSGQSHDAIDPSAFVGRGAVLAQIRASKNPVLLTGQAGIGKSALARRLARTADAVTTIAGDGAKTPSSYQPFGKWLVDQIGSKLPALQDLRETFPSLTDEAQRALALVLGLAEGQSLLTQRSSFALKALIEDSLWRAITATQPNGLLIFEDLHWLDNASFGVLVHMLRNVRPKNHQILLTSRETSKIGEYLGRCPITVISLAPLSDGESADMLDALSDGEITTDKRAWVIAQAAGIPLFIEQLFKRATSGPAATPEVPGALKDILADQIDATGPTKPVLQSAAVIGNSFTLDLLNVIAAEYAPLDPHLDRACRQGVLKQIGDGQWAFAHALLHQAAYDSLLRDHRVAYHARIAAYLQEKDFDAVRRNPALLTTHLSRSRQLIPAIENYLTVSQWALFQGAFDDAEAHVLAAISLCAQAPENHDLRALEIACHSALGSIRMQNQGFTATPVKEAFATVAKLAGSQSRRSAANGPAFYGGFTHAVTSGDKAAADQFSDMLSEVAETALADDENDELLLASLNVDAALHFYSGDFGKASVAFDKLRARYDITRHGAMISRYGADTFAAAQMFECVTRAICGDAQMIPQLMAETDAHQALLNIPVMRPWAQIWGAVPLFYAGQRDAAIKRIRLGLETAEQQAAVFWQVTGGAWLHVMQPSASASDEGLADFRRIIESHMDIGAHVSLPYFQAHYARALAKQERGDDAYRVSLQAVRENAANGLHCWYPEVLRIHAQICDARGGTAGAGRFRSQAASVASRQGAKLWLLRARLDQMGRGEIPPMQLQKAIDALDPLADPPERQAAVAMLASL